MAKNKTFIQILSAMIVLCLLLSACSTDKRFDVRTQVPQGFVHALGRHLVVDGKRIVLKGVNAGGWLLTEDWLTPTSLSDELSGENGQYEFEAALTAQHGARKAAELMEIYRNTWWQEEDFQNIASLGFNMIRLPFGWKDVADAAGALREDAFERLDWFVENCAKYRLFVILDLHGAYGSQNGRHHSGDTTTGGDLFGNAQNEALCVKLWKNIAAHYRDNSWVAGYDLLNEPEGTPGGLTEKVQWDFYDKLYREIRAVDANHLLFMESCWDANHMPDPQDYGWENVAYEYHYYNWENGNDLKSMKAYFRYKAKMERRYNAAHFQVPVLIGEFTFFDNAQCWHYGLSFFEKHEMSWAMWTYKGCVDSNWALYGGYARTADTVVTPQTAYKNAKAVFNSVGTGQSFVRNEALAEILEQYL